MGPLGGARGDRGAGGRGGGGGAGLGGRQHGGRAGAAAVVPRRAHPPVPAGEGAGSGLAVRDPGGGGGKSTVAALLLRFLRPDAGRILWDGVDVEACTVASVRAQIALVTQEPLLFSGTVRENLLAVRPEATGGELRSALRAARAEEFVMALPRQWDTPLGERGARLSGGQRQRLALARAVLRDARILVLDEATSSLDPEGEREVQSALESVLPGRTAVVIAHRLVTVWRADRIHVVVAGRVAEEGTHETLLARGGWYAEAWTLQHPSPAATGTAR
ncbi:MAG: ABC transporter ATP-binding protein [Myxococcaceae bacterium]